jgi:glycosyltransferase involved in cell wall biosynthesis
LLQPTPSLQLSVIVPAWNAAATLSETLASISAQTFRAFEIIIVDDGSTDITAQIAAQFCQSEPRARMISQPNRGVAAARNAGIAVALGEIIAPIDADDLWHRDYLLRLKVALEEQDGAHMAYALSRNVDEQGRVVGTSFAHAIAGPAFFRTLLCNPIGSGSAAIFRRASILAVGGYDETLRYQGAQGCEDYLLILQLAARGPLASVDQHLVGYRIRPGSMARDVAQMTASELLMRRIISARCPELLPERRLRRWIAGSMLLKRAWAASEADRSVAAMLLLIRAAFADPTATLTAVFGRLARPGRVRRDLGSVFDTEGDLDGPQPVTRRTQPNRYMQLQARRMTTIAN